MSNKKIFKELYSKKINKDNNYQIILERIEKDNIKKSILKKTLIPITSILIFFTLIYINVNEKSNSSMINVTTSNQNSDYDMYKNENASNEFTSDIDIQIIDTNYEEMLKLSNYNFLKNLHIPNDLDNQTYQEIYTKDNTTNDYTVLNNYNFKYQNINNDRQIILSFSDKYKPLRDYIFDDNGKTSKINHTEIIIYQNESSYIAIFNYNNINFDIETNNITQEELNKLLTSIIK